MFLYKKRYAQAGVNVLTEKKKNQMESSSGPVIKAASATGSTLNHWETFKWKKENRICVKESALSWLLLLFLSSDILVTEDVWLYQFRSI